LDCLDTINLIWYNNLCWMVHLFFGVWLLIEIFLIHGLCLSLVYCLLLSRFRIINNLFLNWYLVWFKTYYCVLPNMALVKLSKVRWQFWSPHFCFYHFIFNIWNCDLHARRFFNIKRIGSLSQKKQQKNLSFKNTISILICIWPKLSKINYTCIFYHIKKITKK
jgi:hypothetical protein